MIVLFFCILLGFFLVYIFMGISRSRSRAMIVCPRCLDGVNYLTSSIEGRYESVCQECADQQWRDRISQANYPSHPPAA